MAAVVRFFVLVALSLGAAALIARLTARFGSPEAFRRRNWANGRADVPFGTPGGADGKAAPDVAGQTDAFTGEPLDAHRGLYRCRDCQAAYHSDTFSLLAREHGGRCVACRGRSIEPWVSARR